MSTIRFCSFGFLLLVAICVSLVSHGSHTTFYYWTSPDLVKKNHRVSVGIGWGHLFLAYGWPSSTSPWWHATTEPIFGNEPGLEPHERCLPEEREELARQQFGFHIDGVSFPVNYPIFNMPLWYVTFSLLGLSLVCVYFRSTATKDKTRIASQEDAAITSSPL